MTEPYIIAEIGSNCFHSENMNRNIDCAFDQICSAAEADADAVKFQFYTAAELWGPECKGQLFATEQDKYAMPESWLGQLLECCVLEGVDFLCTAFSVAGYRKVNRYVHMHKVASPEMDFEPIMEYVKGRNKQVMYSMGCCIRTPVHEGIIMECVSRYPADPSHYNLSGTKNIADVCSLQWGISDHTYGNQLARTARSMGAEYFEKHVDFHPEGLKTPDSGVSISGMDFIKYVEAIRSQDVIDYHAIKRDSHKLYGRNPTTGFRPWPGNKSGRLIHEQ